MWNSFFRTDSYSLIFKQYIWYVLLCIIKSTCFSPLVEFFCWISQLKAPLISSKYPFSGKLVICSFHLFMVCISQSLLLQKMSANHNLSDLCLCLHHKYRQKRVGTTFLVFMECFDTKKKYKLVLHPQSLMRQWIPRLSLQSPWTSSLAIWVKQTNESL